MAAVPARVNCAVPITAPLVQKVAVASQNVTVPAVTGEPFDTAAVNVTGVPEATEDEDSVSVVVVGPACAAGAPMAAIAIIAARIHVWNFERCNKEMACIEMISRAAEFAGTANTTHQIFRKGKSNPTSRK